MADLPIIVVGRSKNSREVLQVRLDVFKGQPVVDLRAWYDGESGNLKPGRGGLTVSVRHLPKLADAIGKALAIAREAGLAGQ